VGLNQGKRDRASQLLTEKLRDSALPLRKKTELAFLTLELEDRSGALTNECAEILVQAFKANFPNDLRGTIWKRGGLGDQRDVADSLLSVWGQHLIGASDRFDPDTLAHLITSVIEQESDAQLRAQLAESLVSVSKQMDPDEAARVCRLAAGSLVNAFVLEKRSSRSGQSRSIFMVPDTHVSRSDGQLPRGLSILIGRLNNEEATQVAKNLLKAMAEVTDDIGRASLSVNLVLATGKMAAPDAARFLESVLNLKSLEPETLFIILEGLVSATKRMKPVDGRQFCAEMSRMLAEVLKGFEDRAQLTQFTQYLRAFEKLLKQDDQRLMWRSPIQVLMMYFGKEKGVDAIGSLAPLAECLGRDEAARFCGLKAEELASDLKRESDPDAQASIIHVLLELVIRLAPRQADQTVRLLAARAQREGDGKPKSIYDSGSVTSNLYWTVNNIDAGDAAKAARVIVSALGGEKDAGIRSWLLAGLCLVAKRMEPSEAAGICGPVAREMAETLATKNLEACVEYLEEGLSVVASRLKPPYQEQVIEVLVNSFERQTDAAASRYPLMKALSPLADRLSPTQTARILDRFTKDLIAQIKIIDERQIDELKLSIAALSSVGSRMPEIEADQVHGQVARAITSELEREKDADARSRLLQALASVASRMAPSGGTRVLADSLERETDFSSREIVIRALVSISSRMEPGESARILSIALERERNEDCRKILTEALAHKAEPPATKQVSFSTQELVELLKMPTCFGRIRRVVLDHLGNRYGQRFVNHWAFVRYAREKGLKLDFTTPPRRPNPEESLERMLNILDGSPTVRESN
jgi:hypothetical protein